MNPYYILLFIFCGIVGGNILCIMYSMYRNNWVYHRRGELMHWHFRQLKRFPPDSVWVATASFDTLYGTYDEWYNRRWCWDPAKLAGIKEWVA